LVHRLRHHQAEPADDLDADRDADQRAASVGTVPLAGRQHRRHYHRAGMHRTAFEGVVEVLPVRGRAVDEGGAGGAHAPPVADRGAGSLIVPARERRADVVLVARGETQPDHVNQQILALAAHLRRQPRGIERRDLVRQNLGDGGLGKRRVHGHQALRRRASPKPGMRLTAITTAKVMASMIRPSTEIAPRSPDSLRSKISTEITLVSEVNSMMAADSSRMTPTKMKHQVAITLVRSSGAVMSRSVPKRVEPRILPASSRSVWTERNADCSCW